MDAKSKANFINSVAAGQAVPCPKCNTSNKPGTQFCSACGTDMTAHAANAPAFASVDDAASSADNRSAEPVSVFAEGLPSWDVVPPQVLVRRR